MRLRAVVVDDDDLIRSTLSSVMENRGYKVIASSEPLFCPVYLNRKCPCLPHQTCCDILITDINMPNMTGLEFIENQIKNDCKIPNIAIMSGNWKYTDRERTESLGCRIIVKPFGLDEIGQWLDE